MYKDFKQSESLDTGFVGGSGIIWMFSGIVLGLLVGLGMYYFTNNNSSALSMVGTVQDKIKQAQSASFKQQSAKKALVSQQQTQEKKVRETKFSYYAVLPTVNVPTGLTKPIDTSSDATASTRNTQSTQEIETVSKTEPLDVVPVKIAKQKPSLAKKGDFLLRVASYKKRSRANITRGRLTKQGIDAYIQEKKIKGSMWYRVIAGPVDQNSINNWKHSVEKLGHRPMVISLR